MISCWKESLTLEVDSIVRELEGHAVAGCCEPALRALEAQVARLCWPADADAQRERDRLISAIRRVREKARSEGDLARW